MFFLFSTVRTLFTCYTVLLFLRILSSWLSIDYQRHRLVQFLAFYTDPYLNIFRRILPPLGGVIDLSPIIGLLALRFLEMLVLWILEGFL